MVRAILEHGSIHPLSPLPRQWSDGQELVITEAPATDESHDLEDWSRDIDELAVAFPPEDFDLVDATLAEADNDAKEIVRRQMGLPCCRGAICSIPTT